MESRGLQYQPPRDYVKVDPERAKRIAAAFDAMAHTPDDPEVLQSYNAMVDETLAQYRAILATGLKVEFIDYATQGDPYAASPRLAIADVVANNHLWVFSTRDGFGSSEFDPRDNPLLRETEFEISGQKALANDIFRVVHDYFGHIKEGVGFRADGEENAWRAHASMYSPLARRAMTTETRGQNSWVNYGPFGEANRTAGGAETRFADQKIGLLPEWVSEDGRTDTKFSEKRNDVLTRRLAASGIRTVDDFWKRWQDLLIGMGVQPSGLSAQSGDMPRQDRIRQSISVWRKDADKSGIKQILRKYGFPAKDGVGKDGLIAAAMPRKIFEDAGIKPTLENVVSAYNALEGQPRAANDAPDVRQVPDDFDNKPGVAGFPRRPMQGTDWFTGEELTEPDAENDIKFSAKRPVRQEVADAADISRARQIATSQTWATNRDFKLALQQNLRNAARTVDLRQDTPEMRRYITRQILKEAREALVSNSNAVGWYDEKVTTALEVVSTIHPELKTDQQSRFAFIWALAVTSNGVKVNKNFELAERAYRQWKASDLDPAKRKMPTSGIGVGTAAGKIHEGLATYNDLSRRWGYERMRAFATTLQANRDVKTAYGRAVSGEGLDTQVYGAGILGPKIGNGFFMNLFGEFGQLTMDRWWVRMWGRMTGDLVDVDQKKVRESRGAFLSIIDVIKADKAATRSVERALNARLSKAESAEMAKAIIKATASKDVRDTLAEILPATPEREAAMVSARGKVTDFVSVADELRKAAKSFYNNLDGQIEVPGGSRRRDMMREVSQSVLGELQKDHPHLTMADFQALMWYPEKTLYDSAGADNETSDSYEDDEAPDYANAAIALAREQGVPNADIDAAVERARSDIDSRQRARRSGRAAGSVSPQDQAGAGGDTAPDAGQEIKASQQRSINVDGVERSRLNSNGQHIAATEDGVRNFWRWFGDSGAAVGVNPDTGEPVTSSKEKSVTTPRVMYHTTLGDFTTFEVGRTTKNTGTFGEWETQRHAVFVTPDIEASSAYGKRGGKFAGGANSMPVYIKAETPLDLSDGLMWKDEKRFDQIGFSTRWLRNFDWSGFDDAEGKEFVEAAKRLGYDSVIFNDENPDTGDSFVAWAVFNPEQIKSATGNNGQFDPANPDIRYSQQRIVGDSSRPYTPEQKTLFQNVGRTIEVPTLKERIAELRKDLGKRITQGVVDQFAPIKDLTKDGYLLARLSKGAAGAIEAFMQHGKLSINGGVYDADRSGGVLDRVFKPLQGEAEDFLWWVAGNRAERLAKEDRENLFTPKDIAAAKSLDNGTTGFDYVLQHGPNAGKTTRDRTLIYRDALKTFDEFNKNAMDMAEQSGLINKESRQYWEHEFYVPFYRVSEDTGGFVGGNIGKGLVRQQAFKQLKGGTDKLNSDLLANTLQNWSHLIDAAAKNRAAKATLEAAANQGIAVEAPQSTIQQMGKAGGKAVWFMDDGVQRHFLVDPQHSDLLDAINGLQFAGLRGPIMDALSGFKHWLTVGVTASPFFKIRNLIRDSMQAVAVSPLSYNPVTNFRQGLAASSRESQTYVSSLASGGLIRFGTMLEGNASERVRQLVRMGVDDSTILNSPDKIQAVLDKFRKGFMAYSEIGNRGEEINRAALYDQLVKSGVSHAEASLMARDLMDFSMQGSWASVRFLTQVVPFMNARLQGLYKLGRGAKEDKARFATVLGAVGAFSLMLMAMYHDDDDWKKREDWDRNNNWWFKVGGIAYRIPKPFEIGAMATLAERGVELFANDEMTKQRFLKQVLTLVGDNLSMNPIPQAVKPVLDIYANKDSFSGRPIESMGMERLAPDYRFNSRTSMIARGLGTAGQSVLNATGLSKIGVQSLSPVQIDHLIQGYFSWLGAFAVGGADMLVRPMTNEPTRPAADMFKLASGGMVAQVDSASSRYVSDVYEQAKVLEQAYGTWRSLIKQGKVAEAREYFADNKDQIARYRMVEKVKAGEAKFNEMIRMIERSGLDPDAKRERINLIRAQQDRMARVLAPQ